MKTVAVAAGALLCAGAVGTLIASRLIERAYPPRGRHIDIGGLRQHVLESKAGTNVRLDRPPIVLLHGAGCNLADMHLALGVSLAARYDTLFIDRPGHGWSERKGRDASTPTWQADVLCRLLDRLGVARAIVVGHSWGGALAATFALDYPERVAGLVVLAAPTHPHLRGLSRLYAVLALPFAGWLFARTLALPLSAAVFGSAIRAAFLPQAPRKNYLQDSAAFLLLRPRQFLANARDVAGLQKFLARQAARYGELRVPTIIMAGDRDRIANPHQHAMALAAAVPNAKLIMLADLGHMLHHAAAEEVVAAIDALAAMSERQVS